MATYTADDAAAVRAAIVALATGQRETTVRYGDFETRYSEVDLPKLRALLSEIEASVSAATGGSRIRQIRMSTNRGL